MKKRRRKKINKTKIIRESNRKYKKIEINKKIKKNTKRRTKKEKI